MTARTPNDLVTGWLNSIANTHTDVQDDPIFCYFGTIPYDTILNPTIAFYHELRHTERLNADGEGPPGDGECDIYRIESSIWVVYMPGEKEKLETRWRDMDYLAWDIVRYIRSPMRYKSTMYAPRGHTTDNYTPGDGIRFIGGRMRRGPMRTQGNLETARQTGVTQEHLPRYDIQARFEVEYR